MNNILKSLFIIGCLCMGCNNNVLVKTGATSNANNGGFATVVKVYQLLDKTTFDNITQSEFIKTGDVLVEQDLTENPVEFTIIPRTVESFEVELNDKTKYIGIIANLMDARMNGWKKTIAINDIKDEILKIKITSNSMEIVQ